MRYFFGPDVAEPDGEDIPTMAAFRALGLDPDREPEALKVCGLGSSAAPTKSVPRMLWLSAGMQACG